MSHRGSRFGTGRSEFFPSARGHARIGAALWQTPGGVVSEINRINDDVMLFSAEISAWVAAKDPTSPEVTARLIEDSSWLNNLASGPASQIHDVLAHQVNQARQAAAKADATPKTADPSRLAMAQFYLATWIPFVTRWLTFYENNKNWSDQVWWNHAPEAEQFLDQLVAIRANAKRLGMPVHSPKPSSFGKSIADPKRDPWGSFGDFWDSLSTMGKVVIYGGLGLAGLVAVTSIASNLKSGKDPAQNYLALASGKYRR
jgi:hypothetical protein